MQRFPVSLTLLLGLSTLSCQRVFFDHREHRQGYNLSDAEVQNLQYYLYNTIELSRTLTSSEREVDPNHRLVVRDGQRTEVVTFPHRIPGLVREVGEDQLTVQFEGEPDADDPWTLTFVLARTAYSVTGSRPIANYYVFKGDRTVQYAGKTFGALVIRQEDGEDHPLNVAVLQIGADAFEKEEMEEREVPGLEFED